MWGCETRWVARRHPGHWQSASSWRLCRDWCMGSKRRGLAGGKAVNARPPARGMGNRWGVGSVIPMHGGKERAGRLPPDHGRSCCQGEPGSLLHRSKHFGTGAVRVDHVALCEVWFHGFGVKTSRESWGAGLGSYIAASSPPAPSSARLRPSGALRGPVLMFYPCTGICVG